MASDANEQEMLWYNSRQDSAKIDVSDMGLGTLTELIEAKFIDLAPDFQRRERWGLEKKSNLIDSFMRNIPVPPAYLAEDQAQRGLYAVIDGKQRLTTISDFLMNRFRLSSDLDGPFAGKTFEELPQAVQVSLKMKTLRTTTILYGSDIKVVHEVFIRLNTGGESLTGQELRNVAFRGTLNSRLIELANNDFLRRQFKIDEGSQSYKKMQDVEMILRFFTLAEHYLSADGNFVEENIKLPHGLNGAMDDHMERNRNLDPVELAQLSRLFIQTISTVESIWGAEAFKTPDRNQARTPMYDAEMIAVASIVSAGADVEHLKNCGRDISELTRQRYSSDPALNDSITKGTNTPSKITYRIKAIYEVLESCCA